MFATEQGRDALLLRTTVSKKTPISLVPDPVEGVRLPEEQGGLPPRIAEYLARHEVPSPCLIVDVDIIEHNYVSLNRALPLAKIYYAVKANPAREVVARLAALGSHFDTASPNEIDLCLELGVPASRVSYGNTIKKQADIASAYTKGVRLFAFDSAEELEKIAHVAPDASVYCRVLMLCAGAEWPLSRKFGCTLEMARDLLRKARDLGLDPYGVSFHVGSQQTDLHQWDIALGQTADLFAQLKSDGIELRMLNLGGGFPARYRARVNPVEAYAEAVKIALVRRFGHDIPEIIIEPGRSIAGDSGVIQAEVVLTAHKGDEDGRRWVYLDIGKFSGLAETMDEAIKYRFMTPHDGGETVPVVIAGPTCDSADILYEKTPYRMPARLKAGDKVLILSTGAYTTTYSAVNFNGFAPLETICI